MSLTLTGDLGDFLADFGVSATFTHGGHGSPVTVIFLNAFEVAQAFGLGIESASPQAVGKTSDLSTAVHGDTLSISGVQYYIRGIQPDGTGITTLVLAKD